MTRTLLMVGVGMAGMAYVEAALRLGVDVHGVEILDRKEGYEGHLAGFTPSRGLVEELWVEGALRAAADGPVDGVLAFTDWQVVAAAVVQEQLGVPGPSLRAAVASRNKGLQRSVFAAAGIPQPEFTVVEDIADGREWMLDNLSVVVKPLGLAGGAGVEGVADRDQVDIVISRRSGTGRVIIERQLHGPEYVWDGVVQDGQVIASVISTTETSGPPWFVELGHHVPAPWLDDRTRGSIEAIARAAIDAVGMRTGPFHVEVSVDGGEASLIEVGVCLPGGGIPALLNAIAERDWHELIVRAALGEQLTPGLGPTRRGASYLPVLRAGRVREVVGLDQIRRDPGVVHADIRVRPGDVVPDSTSSMEQAGEFLVVADDQDAVEAGLATIVKTLDIVTDRTSATYKAKVASAGASIYPIY